MAFFEPWGVTVAGRFAGWLLATPQPARFATFGSAAARPWPEIQRAARASWRIRWIARPSASSADSPIVSIRVGWA